MKPRLWAEVDLDAAAMNYHAVQARVSSSVRVMAVVKADAYGHGALAVARRLEAEGAAGFGVGDAGEALELREGGIRGPILILGAVVPGEIRPVVEAGISVSLFSTKMARLIDREARSRGRRVNVHLKVDTGMGRLGQYPAEIIDTALEAKRSKALDLAGLFTHCPANDPELVSSQLRAFRELQYTFSDMGVHPGLKHMANSSILHHYSNAHFDMVRPGICLYGVDPGDLRRAGAALRPVLTVRTQIVYLKDVPAGTFVGYRPGYKT
ncbi:MAG: alanine racemase, partial [Planctomycetota bacterium]